MGIAEGFGNVLETNTERFLGGDGYNTYKERISLISFLKIWRRCTRIIDDPGVVA